MRRASLLRQFQPYKVRVMSEEISPALTMLTESETMMRDAARKFAREVVAPKVKEMDEHGKLDPEIIQACFDMGFMGIEVPERM